MEQYVITNGEKYIKSNFNGKVTQTTNITMADVFNTKQQAMNFLKNSVTKAWQRKYYVAEYENGQVVQCTVPKPPKTVRKTTNKIFDVGDKSLGIVEWEIRLNGMENIFRDAAKRADELSQEMSDVEGQIIDWEHYIEFTKLNAMQGYKAYSALNRLFEQRRAIKNEQRLLSVINRNQNCSEGMTEIFNTLDELKHQKYSEGMAENYYLLDDMERYMPNFNRSAYEHLSVSDLIPICRDYYSKHLPVDVTTWIRVNEPSKDLIYGNGLGKQVVFVRDVIGSRLFYKLRDKKDKCIETYAIGTHRSKSVLLPVMEIQLKKYGINLIFRYNFYDWCVSVGKKFKL